MNMIRVDGKFISLHSGVVTLTAAQAALRLHCLEGGKLAAAHEPGKLKDRQRDTLRANYTLIGETHFKTGEVLGYDGDIPRGWHDIVTVLDAPASVPVKSQAERQHDELVAAMAGIAGDDQQNIALDDLLKLLEGRINFDPTPDQLERAWTAHVAKP